MKFRLNFTIRKFKKEDDEHNDSGYYNDLSVKKNGHIDINIEDDSFEQILTIYHEVTHFIFDFVSQYKLDPTTKKYVQLDDTLKKDWRKHNAEIEAKRKDGRGIEEMICCRIERAIAPLLKKHIPKSFFKRFFK